ncbi:hypothetical protein PQX77_013835 [Marasmius sp. AFHP31]|nr:hypothetical protein PQX77_013835 [Marasmius sp. AFHP31]
MVSEDLLGESPAPADNGDQGNSARNDDESHVENEEQVAQSPFDNPDTADAIVKTSDGVGHFIYKVILSVISPYFHTIFSADPATSKLGHKDPEDGQRSNTIATPALVVYSIEEESRVFGFVLRYFYPGQAAPQLTKIDDLGLVLVAMVKYHMQVITPFQIAIGSLLDIAKPPTIGGTHPAVIRVFALFYRYRDSIPAILYTFLWSTSPLVRVPG